MTQMVADRITDPPLRWARRLVGRHTVEDWRPSSCRLSPFREQDRHRRGWRSQSPELHTPVSLDVSAVSSRILVNKAG